MAFCCSSASIASQMVVVPSSLSNVNFYIFADDGSECIDVNFKSLDVKKGRKVLFFKVNLARTVIINELKIKMLTDKLAFENIEELNNKIFAASTEVNDFKLDCISAKETVGISAEYAKLVPSEGFLALRLKDVKLKNSKEETSIRTALLVFSEEKIYIKWDSKIFEIAKLKN